MSAIAMGQELVSMDYSRSLERAVGDRCNTWGAPKRRDVISAGKRVSPPD
jgi:hypothetical protein